MGTTPIFTAAQRRSLDRIAGHYLQFAEKEADFTISDLFSIGLLLHKETSKSTRNEGRIVFYKKAYLALSSALKIPNSELFLLRLSSIDSGEPWDDFNDFKSVWHPKWFANQIHLRQKLFSFTNDTEFTTRPDFWGANCSEEYLKKELLAVRDSFSQIHVGLLVIVFKIDTALAALMGWGQPTTHISFQSLKETYHFPQAPG
jgi:hypothetical protein